jgi:uncharacterized protein
MHEAARTLLCMFGLAVFGVTVALGASLDCKARLLSPTETAICDDPQLSRMEEQMARRLNGLSARLNFGQYLGLRHWQAAWTTQRRNECDTDRDCIAASFRAQARFLDRFQRCIGASITRRGCLRDMLAGEQESMRR